MCIYVCVCVCVYVYPYMYMYMYMYILWPLFHYTCPVVAPYPYIPISLCGPLCIFPYSLYLPY